MAWLGKDTDIAFLVLLFGFTTQTSLCLTFFLTIDQDPALVCGVAQSAPIQSPGIALGAICVGTVVA